MKTKFPAGLFLGGLFALAGSPVFAQTLTHDYTLDNTLADSLGGPSLVSLGGTLSASGYAFPADEGLSLSSAIDANNYSIQVDFSIDSTDGYRKIIDFENKGSDNGVYNLNTYLDFYPYVTSATSDVAASTPLDLIVTRDGTTGLFSAYVNGTLAYSFDDSTSQQAVFNGPDDIINFFVDDDHTGGRESSSGDVTTIKIWDGALTAAEVETDSLPGVPDMANAGGLLGVAVAGLLVFKKAFRPISGVHL